MAPPDDAEGGKEEWVNVVGGRQRAGERGGGWGERRGGTSDGKGGERFRVIGVRGMCWKGAIGGIGFQGSAAFRNGKKGRGPTVILFVTSTTSIFSKRSLASGSIQGGISYFPVLTFSKRVLHPYRQRVICLSTAQTVPPHNSIYLSCYPRPFCRSRFPGRRSVGTHSLFLAGEMAGQKRPYPNRLS